MVQSRTLSGFRFGDMLLSLVCVVALCLLPSCAFAQDEVEGPLPLIEIDWKEEILLARKANFASAVFAGRGIQGTGAFSAGAIVVAGKHEKVRAWEVSNIMAYDDLATTTGTSTLIGISAWQPGFSTPYGSLVTLKWGNWLHCWPLEDIDKFSPLPAEWLKVITDGRIPGEGGIEAGIYSAILIRAHFTSEKAFAGAVRKGLTRVHLLEEPGKHRGVVVRVEGTLQKINRYDPPFEASRKGVSDLYEAWIANGRQVTCVLFTRWPEGLPKSYLGKAKIADPPAVTIDGYFYKLWKNFEFSINGRKDKQNVPILMGNTLLLTSAEEKVLPTSDWVKDLVFAFVAVFVGTVVSVLGLTLWLRRSDARIRKRLFAARSPEFILPPPDELAGVRIAPPVYKSEPVKTASQPRFHIPPDLGHHPESGPSGKSGDRGSPDDSPEDAGS